MTTKIACIVKRSGVAKIARQPQFREQVDTLSVSPRQARHIDFLLASNRFGINSGADTYRLKKSCTAGFDGFRFHLESFSRPFASQQSAVIGDMRHDFNLVVAVIA